MERTREYRREARNKAIIRKKKICTTVYGYDWYTCDGKYNKGKIHCGCSLCKPKKTIKNIRESEKEALSMYDYINDVY